MIKKIGTRYILYSKDGKKRLGTFTSRSEAVKREKQINYFKHKKKSK